jgi:putative transposase
MVETAESLSIAQQCDLLELHRSTYYYEPAQESSLNWELMQHIDRYFMEYPFTGTRRMREHLYEVGYEVNRKRIQRLYEVMNLHTLFPGACSSKPHPGHEHYPYLLRSLSIEAPRQVYAMDITYVPMQQGFMYVAAAIDLFSRFCVGWDMSNTMSALWCRTVVEQAFERYGAPQVFNTDQGSQFTSKEFLDVLRSHQVQISMDGKGRCKDNIFIERLWRSLKYESVYLYVPESTAALYEQLQKWFYFYNYQRHHQSLNYHKPYEFFRKE